MLLALHKPSRKEHSAYGQTIAINTCYYLKDKPLLLEDAVIIFKTYI